MRFTIDPIRLDIFRSAFASVAEEMGVTLRRTAFSPNIKERRDYSCAIFDANGRTIAQGEHMPVHLGSMPMSVKAALDAQTMRPGDVVIVNDPYQGGTHLPDITMVTPVFVGGPPSPRGKRSRPNFYVANRAHHSDIGGMSPGSMPLSTEIFQEGVRIPPLKLYDGGRLNAELLQLILSNVRTPDEREGDLTAQIAANRTGERRLTEIVAKYGLAQVHAYMDALLRYSERMVRQVIRSIPDGVYRAVDYLDDDGIQSNPIPIRVRLHVKGDTVDIDFTGTSPQVAGCVNAVLAITISAVFYVFRGLTPLDIPANAGVLRPIRVKTPPRSLVDAQYPAAAAAGNVETSQRIVDVLLRALSKALPDRVPAASNGTMNNLTLGGIHPATGRPFGYYETVCGGMGAGPGHDGNSGIHTHMTNSLNTPVEALEYAFPFLVTKYRLRAESGGAGKFRGGDGVIREFEALTDCDLTILADRRRFAPYGLNGGQPGQPGETVWEHDGTRTVLPSKVRLRIGNGDRIGIYTPGGGGWGRPPRPGPSHNE